MVYRRSIVLSLVIAAVVAVRSIGTAIIDVGRDFVAALIAIVALPNTMRFAGDVPEGYVDCTGEPNDPALLNFLRHEAGYSKRSAQRNC